MDSVMNRFFQWCDAAYSAYMVGLLSESEYAIQIDDASDALNGVGR